MDLIFSLQTSLIICAINALFWDDMLLQKVREYFDNKLSTKFGVWLSKPLYSCIICMSSIWGGSIYLLSGRFSLDIIPHILTVAGINVLISGIVYLAYERTLIK